MAVGGVSGLLKTTGHELRVLRLLATLVAQNDSRCRDAGNIDCGGDGSTDFVDGLSGVRKADSEGGARRADCRERRVQISA
jgi:hypothetical protein